MYDSSTPQWLDPERKKLRKSYDWSVATRGIIDRYLGRPPRAQIGPRDPAMSRPTVPPPGAHPPPHGAPPPISHQPPHSTHGTPPPHAPAHGVHGTQPAHGTHGTQPGHAPMHPAPHGSKKNSHGAHGSHGSKHH